VRHNRDGEQKLFNLFGLFSLFFFLATSLFGESFADFKRVQSASFSQYKDKRDNAFNSYIKTQWQEYRAYISPTMYKKPKPQKIVPLKEKALPKAGPFVVIKVPKQKPSEVEPKPSKKEKHKGALAFDFFGVNVGFSLDKKIADIAFYPQNQAGIANFFSLLASSDYERTIEELQRYKKDLYLNDWGLYLLVTKLSKKLYGDRDRANIYAWFLFNKLHYDVKIALSERKRVYLLHYLEDTLYATPRYLFGSKYYYLISAYNIKYIEKIYTYKKSYPEAERALDFSLKKLPKFPKDMLFKERTFSDYGKKYTFSYHYNKNIVAFMQTYPQVNYRIYFNAPLESITYTELLKDIKKYTDGKKMSEAINFVLRFVQKAFRYERDQEQFGKEKVMFAEETLVYDASDCEDRAVLFSYLIEKIFGISAVGVKYSDHMSTALHIPMQGDSIMVGRRRYVMADPTYINANIGQEIPKYRAAKPEYFIHLSNN